MTTELLAEQLAYYRARAGEYDDWWYRRGRYDRGSEVNARWFTEVDAARQALRRFLGPKRIPHAVDLAAGTGLWTAELLELAEQVTAVDAAPEVLEINRDRNARNASRLQLEIADLFAWEPRRLYDLVFAGFWLSHVPPDRLDDFLDRVTNAIPSAGHVFFLDSRFSRESTARDHVLNPAETCCQPRRLKDGREFRVVKVFLDPGELAAKLAQRGFHAAGKSTGEFFLHVAATRQ